MNPTYLPASAAADVPAWQQTVVAFPAEKERRSGSRWTIESYARMLRPFLDAVGSPDRVTPAHVVACGRMQSAGRGESRPRRRSESHQDRRVCPVVRL